MKDEGWAERNSSNFGQNHPLAWQFRSVPGQYAGGKEDFFRASSGKTTRWHGNSGDLSYLEKYFAYFPPFLQT